VHPPPPRRIIPERLWSSLGAAGAIPLDAHPLRPRLGAPPGAVDVSSRGLRAGRPPDSPRGPRSGRRVGRRRRCIIATAAAVAQAPERDPPAGIGVPFRPHRASSDPPCCGRPGQDDVLDRATTPPETSSRPRRRLRPHPRPRRREQTRHVHLLFAPLDHIVIEYPLSSFVRPQGPSHRFVVVVLRGGGARIKLVGAREEERAEGGAAAIAASVVVSWSGGGGATPQPTPLSSAPDDKFCPPRFHLRRRVVFFSRRVFLHPVC
jgi:hypothetical protein